MIQKKVVDLLESLFLHTQFTEDMFEVQLTDPSIGLDAVRMYELLLCIEKEFLISYTFEELHTNGFHSVNEIVHSIKIKLS